jgi:GntR family transcriptional regulator / MocR family aminotransferase
MSPHAAGALPLLLSLDPARAEPLNQQLYHRLRSMIQEQRLRPGTRLPSTRTLARDLGLSRNTVVHAFERLTAEGYLEGNTGGGTRVAQTLPESLLPAQPSSQSFAQSPAQSSTQSPTQSPTPSQSLAREREHAPVSQRAQSTAACPVPLRTSRTTPGTRAFRLGASAIADFPIDVWGRLSQRRWRRIDTGAMDYGLVAGYKPLREAIAAYLRTTRGVICEADQVLIVNGSQQALDLATRVLLDPGDAAWMEDPGYDGARGALVAGGARVIPVPIDDEGLCVSSGVRQSPRARLAYVTPSHQFPLTSTMSLRRRRELLRWARTRRAWILEDDYDSEFRYSRQALTSLQGLDGGTTVIYAGTFSKVLFPALRIGYLVVPPALVGTFVKVRFFLDVHCSTFVQSVLADFITDGHFERHIRRMRRLYRERQDALATALRRQLHGLLDVQPSDGGMHLVAWLPPGVDDREASQRAAAEGVEAVPLSSFMIGSPSRGALLLGYARTTTDDIVDGCARLARALTR